MKSQVKNIYFWLYLITVYLLILAFRGFEFASGDMVEIINYSKHMMNPKLLVNDFYINNISAVIPNERYVFSGVLKLFLGDYKWMIFITHSILTLFMLLGLFKIISLYIRQESFVWLTVLILFGPLYKINLGGNELYYNMLISSFVAKVFGVWAIYFYLIKKRSTAIIFILFSTLIHPTVGSQLFIIVIASRFLSFLENRGCLVNKKELISVMLYLLVAGGYIFVLLKAVQDYGIDKNSYFEIFEFRVPHHFFPAYFPIKSYIIELMLYGMGIMFMLKYKMNDFTKFSIIIFFGILVYLLGVYLLKIPFVLNTQWFKATIWLELIYLIAVMKYFDDKVKLNLWQEKAVFYAIITLCLVAWIMIIGGNNYFAQKPYQFSENIDLNEEELLGKEVKRLTKSGDQFIWPIEFSGFKYYAERGAFVDYKSVVHRGTVLDKWYSRIKKVYGIDIKTRRKFKDIKKSARKIYKGMTIEKIKQFRELGIDYIVQYSDVNLDLPLITENKKYKVYKL